jgi:hypothetical protein
MEREGNLNRRSFLKGVGVAGAGVLGAGLLGCTDTADGAPSGTGTGGGYNITWNKEADVVVVGSGTVAFAALAAVEYGAESVAVLEKMETWGGTTAVSGGGMGIPLTDAARNAGVQDSREEVLKYYAAATTGRAVQKNVLFSEQEASTTIRR